MTEPIRFDAIPDPAILCGSREIAYRGPAGHVLDLRDEPAVGKYVMFFHGSTREGFEIQEIHGHSSRHTFVSDPTKSYPKKCVPTRVFEGYFPTLFGSA